MAEIRYLVGKWNPGEARLRRAPTLDLALDRVRQQVLERELPGPYRVKPHGRKEWSEGMRLFEALGKIEAAMEEAKDDADLDTLLLRSADPDREVVLAVREEIIEPEATLPSGSESWPEATRDIYQFVYAPGQFRSGNPTFLGVFNCRLTRQGGSWSYHSWGQALDAGITRTDGTQNHDLALEMERKVTAEFGDRLMFVVTFREDPAFHFNHDHIQVKPERAGQTPPCAS